MLLIYSLTVFLSSFLLFLVQPMLTKAILPQFGGSYLVWGASMVFYQGVLLAGYLFSHQFQRRLGVVRYAHWHWVMLLIPFVMCPFRFDRMGASVHSFGLGIGVFAMLFMAVSLPFLTLSMTSLVLQRWLTVRDGKLNPYVLYSASNLGSISALLLYPTVIEPFSNLKEQGAAWWCGYGILVVLHFFCMPRGGAKKDASLAVVEDVAGVGVSRMQQLVWLLLSMAACAMLLSVTNVLTLDVASIPFLWVLPLMVYLLAFVVTFKRRIWFPASIQKGLYWVVIVGVCLRLLPQLRLELPIAVALVLHLMVLFVATVNCCGWLVRTKPQDHRELTTFYVVIAVGGLLGSLLVSWVIPLISHSLIEYLLGLSLTFVAVSLAQHYSGCSEKESVDGYKIYAVGVLLIILSVTVLPRMGCYWSVPSSVLLVMIALPVTLLLRYGAGNASYTALLLAGLIPVLPNIESLVARARHVSRLRNYYGIYKVYDEGGVRFLEHGTTQHGREYLSGPKRFLPLAYYHPTTPAAGVLQSMLLPKNDVGMIGLGTGALAAYMGKGQSFTV